MQEDALNLYFIHMFWAKHNHKNFTFHTRTKLSIDINRIEHTKTLKYCKAAWLN